MFFWTATFAGVSRTSTPQTCDLRYMRNATERLDTRARLKLERMVGERGVIKTSIAVGVGRESVIRAVAGMGVRRGTAALLRAAVEGAPGSKRSAG